MEKHLVLIGFRGCRGCYTAITYNRIGGYYKEFRFLDYSKKEILYRLRNNYGVVCPRGSY